MTGPQLGQRLFENVVGVAPGVVRDVHDDFVPALFVEWLCLEAESRQEDAVAYLRPGFVLGRFEELSSVPLPAKRLYHPERFEVEPASPDVAEGTAEDRAPVVLKEDGERAVVGVPGSRNVEERQTLPDEGGVPRFGPRLRDDSEVPYALVAVHLRLRGYVEDDLPDPLALLHVLHRGRGLFEREGLVDDGLEA